MKKILFLLLLPLFLFAQKSVYVPFVTGNDTIFSAGQDTLQIRIGITELGWGPWETPSKVLCENDTVYITADDKANEYTKIYRASDEDWWTWCHIMQLRILSQSDTLYSRNLTIGDWEGAVSIFVQPTIYGDATVDTVIYKVRVGGR